MSAADPAPRTRREATADGTRGRLPEGSGVRSLKSLRNGLLDLGRFVGLREDRERSTKLRNGGPKPLIDPEGRFVVYWSPKSACTTTLIWFLHVTGMEAAARAHDAWPHRYRIDIYNRTEAYRTALARGFSDMRRIRVIRDPVDRALSSFRHAVGTSYADEAMARFLGRDVGRGAKFSLKEFIDYLEAEDIERTNTHHRQQLQPVEKRYPPTDVINISRTDLFKGLNDVEAAIGMTHTDFSTLEWLHKTEAPRKPVVARQAEDAYTRRMTSREARGVSEWPPKEALLTAEAKARLTHIYRADIEAYRDYL